MSEEERKLIEQNIVLEFTLSEKTPELMKKTIKEALEDGTLSLEDEIDYADMTEEEYKQEIERLNNIINELDKQNGELGANLSLIEDRINKTNWWLENMLKQAKNMETRAIISGTLELLLGSDKE